jgi:hypothetical protein
MKDMVPFAISGSGLLIITVAITIALVLLFVLYRGETASEREQEEGDREEHPDGAPQNGGEQHPGG